MRSKIPSLVLPLLALAACLLASCQQQNGAYVSGPDKPPRAVVRNGVAITLRDQKLTVFRDGKKVKDYDISSSKYGVGSARGSNRTPEGIHAVSKKVGDGQPSGMVFKACRPTGEVIPADSTGRDPIVTRIIQLAGLESFNHNSHSRRIYIHGTPEESKIGRPASYGCIRMRSSDVLDLYNRVYRGMPVAIERCSQETYLAAEKDSHQRSIAIPASIVASLPTDAPSYRPSSVRHRSSSSKSRLASKSKAKSKTRRLATRTTKRSKGRVVTKKSSSKGKSKKTVSTKKRALASRKG